MEEKVVYVNKNELLAMLEQKIKEGNERMMAVVDSDFIALVDDATEINDVAPVVHGEWIPDMIMSRNPYARNYNCSICNYSPIEPGKYCGNCGAKMDGGKE